MTKITPAFFRPVKDEIKFVVSFIVVHIIFLLVTYYSFGQVTTAWTAHYQSPWMFRDYGREIKTDAQGNVYVSGHAMIGPSQQAYVVIVKYNSNGIKLWEYFSPDTHYYMEDMEVDELTGTVYYAGSLWNDTTAEWDYVTVKIDSSGNDIWSQQYDGNGIGAGWDYGWAVAVDQAGDVYITGHSQGTFNGYDWVTIKYNSAGVQQWVARWVNPDNATLSSNYFNEAYEIFTDNAGNVYVSGYAFNGTSHELTLLKYDASGNLLWERDIDTHGHWSQISKDYMKLDAADNIYLAGNVRNPVSGCDILLVKYNPQGNLLWVTTWNSSTNDSDYVCGEAYADQGLMLDANANIFISGTSQDPSTLFTENMVTLKYDSSGNFLWQNIFDGIGNDQDIAYSIGVDNLGNAYVCGSTYTTAALNDEDYVTFKINGLTGATMWTRMYNAVVDWIDAPHAIYVDNQQNVYVTGLSMINTDWMDPRNEIVTIKYSQTTTGIDEAAEENSFIAFPNPFSDELRIKFFDGMDKGSKVMIIDVTGKIVEEQSVSKTSGALSMGKKLSAGVYTVQLRNSNHLVKSFKVVKLG